MMFADKIVASLRKDSREKRSKKRVDVVAEQVKKVLSASDQQLILMVRS